METSDHKLSQAFSAGIITMKGAESKSTREKKYELSAHENVRSESKYDRRSCERIDRNHDSKESSEMGTGTSSNITLLTSSVISHYRFPLQDIPVDRNRKGYIAFQDLSGLRHLVDGSNSNIVRAIYKKDTHVIIKIIQKHPSDVRVAEKEFLLENEILMRLNHPNIVAYLGGGKESDHRRRFLVLELLSGGSLMTHMSRPNRPVGPPFSYTRVLEIGKEFAEALQYLHETFHPAVTVIHRDLKPDNIGFTDTGRLKLMDFGLCAVVKKRTDLGQTYTMTGSTGSLRYMAPEVMREIPYTERVDVYSYGLIMWQVATGLTPFGHLTRDNFVEKVVQQHERPSLHLSTKNCLSNGLAEMVMSCWHVDPQSRYSASELVELMSEMTCESPAKPRSSVIGYLRSLVHK